MIAANEAVVSLPFLHLSMITAMSKQPELIVPQVSIISYAFYVLYLNLRFFCKVCIKWHNLYPFELNCHKKYICIYHTHNVMMHLLGLAVVFSFLA